MIDSRIFAIEYRTQLVLAYIPSSHPSVLIPTRPPQTDN